VFTKPKFNPGRCWGLYHKLYIDSRNVKDNKLSWIIMKEVCRAKLLHKRWKGLTKQGPLWKYIDSMYIPTIISTGASEKPERMKLIWFHLQNDYDRQLAQTVFGKALQLTAKTRRVSEFLSLWQKCIACKIYLPPATIFPLLRVLGENLQWSAALDLLQSEKWREEVTFEKAEKIQALTCILQGVVEHTRKNSVDKAKVEEFLSLTLNILRPPKGFKDWEWRDETHSDIVSLLVEVAFRIEEVPASIQPLIETVCNTFFDLQDWDRLSSEGKRKYINQLNAYARASVLSNYPSHHQRLQGLFMHLGVLPDQNEWPISECVLSLNTSIATLKDWIDPSRLKYRYVKHITFMKMCEVLLSDSQNPVDGKHAVEILKMILPHLLERGYYPESWIVRWIQCTQNLEVKSALAKAFHNEMIDGVIKLDFNAYTELAVALFRTEDLKECFQVLQHGSNSKSLVHNSFIQKMGVYCLLQIDDVFGAINWYCQTDVPENNEGVLRACYPSIKELQKTIKHEELDSLVAWVSDHIQPEERNWTKSQGIDQLYSEVSDMLATIIQGKKGSDNIDLVEDSEKSETSKNFGAFLTELGNEWDHQTEIRQPTKMDTFLEDIKDLQPNGSPSLDFIGNFHEAKTGSNPRISKLLEMTEFGHPVKENFGLIDSKRLQNFLDLAQKDGFIPNEKKNQELIWDLENLPSDRKQVEKKAI